MSPQIEMLKRIRAKLRGEELAMADASASKRKAAVSIGRRLVAVLLWFNEAIILACPIARKAKMKPLPPIIYDAKHWRRDRAEEARRKAESMAESQSRDAMLEVAASYERLAECAAARKPEHRPA